MHRSFRQRADSPHKPGAAILERGRPLPRPPGNEPQCKLCPKASAWTSANRAVYRRWRFWRMGADVGGLDAADFRTFYRLEEAAREIESELRQRDINLGVSRSFS